MKLNKSMRKTQALPHQDTEKISQGTTDCKTPHMGFRTQPSKDLAVGSPHTPTPYSTYSGRNVYQCSVRQLALQVQRTFWNESSTGELDFQSKSWGWKQRNGLRRQLDLYLVKILPMYKEVKINVTSYNQLLCAHCQTVWV